MAQRQTLDLHAVKTRSLIYQNPDGSFPPGRGVLEIGSNKGHAAWTHTPEINTVTLVNTETGEGGELSFDGDNLLLNGAPVGGGGPNISGGSNILLIEESGVQTINLDITTSINMNKQSLFDANAISLGRTTEPAIPSINMFTNSSTGRAEINMTDEVTAGHIYYSSSESTMSVVCDKNITIYTNNVQHAIELGSDRGKISISTGHDIIEQRISDISGVYGVTTLSPTGDFCIGKPNMNNNPSLAFQGISAEANVLITMYSSNRTLSIQSAQAALQIAVPLHDVETDTAGSEGQVLTSQGVGKPPKWANVPSNSNLTYTITDSYKELNLNIPGATTLRIRVFTQAAGGGGSGGYQSSIDYGGGGGGAGYTSDYIFDIPNNTTLKITNGVSGLGGPPNESIDGDDADPSLLEATINEEILSYETRGGKGGKAAIPAVIDGDGGIIEGQPGTGGEGDPPGSDGTGTLGGKGGGFYGGSGYNRNGGRELSTGMFSGAGGGGGTVTDVSGASTGGDGARGFTRIEILGVF